MARNLDPSPRAFDRRLHFFPRGGGIGAAHGLRSLCFREGRASALHVDLFRAFRGIRQHRNALRQHFREPADNRDVPGFGAFFVAEHSDAQLRQ